jgi:DNA-binding NarL/FixJ family response regulator
MTGPVTVLVVDDQTVVREGLVLLLGLLPDIEVVGSAVDGREAVEMVARSRPDVVLMDLRMPRCDGVEAIRMLRQRGLHTRVIALTTYSDDQSVLGAVRAGARGYLTKDAGPAEIQKAIHRVMADQAVLDPAVQHHLLEAFAATPAALEPSPPGPSAPADGLTPREVEVLGLIAAGLTNQEIAGRLFVTEATVKTHINHLLAKINARDRAHAVTYAYRHGLLPVAPSDEGPGPR